MLRRFLLGAALWAVCSVSLADFGTPVAGATAEGTDNASLNAPLPAGFTAGQLGVVYTCSRSNSIQTLGTPTGTTAVAVSSRQNYFLWVATGLESGNITIPWNGGAGDKVFAVAVRVPTNATGWTLTGIVKDTISTSGTAVDIPTPALTVVPTDDTLILWGGCRQAQGTAYTAPATGTILAEANNVTGQASSFAVARAIQGAAANIAVDKFDSASAVSAAYISRVLSLIPPTEDAPPGPTLDASITAQDSDDYTITGMTGSSLTVSAVACIAGTTPATVPQAIAGNCTGGVPAEAAVNEVWNGANSFVLGGSLPFPLYDISITDGTNLLYFPSEFLDVWAGRVRQTLSSVSATSPLFGFTSAAAGDIWTVDAVTDPGAYAVTLHDTAEVTYAANGDTSRQSYASEVYDYSAGEISDYELLYENNHDCVFQGGLDDLFLAVDEAMQSTTIGDDCLDEDGDVITGSLAAGSVPTGTSVTPGEPGTWSGTPTVVQVVTPTFRGTDFLGGYGEIQITVEVLDVTLTVPSVIGETSDNAVDTLSTANLLAFLDYRCFRGSEVGGSFDSNSFDVASFDEGSFSLGESIIGFDDVFDQDPAADAEVDPFSIVTLGVSRGLRPCVQALIEQGEI